MNAPVSVGGGRVSVDMTSSGTPDVKRIPPETLSYVLPPPPEVPSEKQGERVNALIVTVLTVACTVLALFDLFLLAWGL
jgi:hypothetical protein